MYAPRTSILNFSLPLTFLTFPCSTPTAALPFYQYFLPVQFYFICIYFSLWHVFAILALTFIIISVFLLALQNTRYTEMTQLLNIGLLCRPLPSESRREFQRKPPLMVPTFAIGQHMLTGNSTYLSFHPYLASNVYYNYISVGLLLNVFVIVICILIIESRCEMRGCWSFFQLHSDGVCPSYIILTT